MKTTRVWFLVATALFSTALTAKTSAPKAAEVCPIAQSLPSLGGSYALNSNGITGTIKILTPEESKNFFKNIGCASALSALSSRERLAPNDHRAFKNLHNDIAPVLVTLSNNTGKAQLIPAAQYLTGLAAAQVNPLTVYNRYPHVRLWMATAGIIGGAAIAFIAQQIYAEISEHDMSLGAILTQFPALIANPGTLFGFKLTADDGALNSSFDPQSLAHLPKLLLGYFIAVAPFLMPYLMAQINTVITARSKTVRHAFIVDPCIFDHGRKKASPPQQELGNYIIPANSSFMDVVFIDRKQPVTLPLRVDIKPQPAQ